MIDSFIAVGENIHCTRIYKVGGKFAKEVDGGGFGIYYSVDGETRILPVPDTFVGNADWEAGKVKHCAVAIWQGNYGDDVGKQAGIDYIQASARKQEADGAKYLDINVDEFSTDIEERVRLMRWTVDVAQQAVSIPVSVDSSNMEILKAGLEAADKGRGRPMVNSVSLERADAIEVSRAFNAVVIASAAGEKDLPSNNEERAVNFARLIPMLKDAGFEDGDLHLDPLVFPISVDGTNGKNFLQAVSDVRGTYGADVHIVAGLSNVSFGMPNRKLINQVFTHLAVEAGADGGIVDPAQINVSVLNDLDPEATDYGIARDLLLGDDEFGMNFIAASRDGTL